MGVGALLAAEESGSGFYRFAEPLGSIFSVTDDMGADWQRQQRLDERISVSHGTRDTSISLERMCNYLNLPPIVREQAESYILQLGSKRGRIRFVVQGLVLLATSMLGFNRGAKEFGLPAAKNGNNSRAIRAMSAIAAELQIEVPRADSRRTLMRGITNSKLPEEFYGQAWDLVQRIRRDSPTGKTDNTLFASVLYWIAQERGIEISQKDLGSAFQVSEAAVRRTWVRVVKPFLATER